MTKTLNIGSISHGTMRTEHLIPAFMDALWEVAPDHAGELQHENQDIFDWLDGGAEDSEEPEDMLYFLDDLFNAMNEHCPPYCYFGSHPGDGADYGCWPHEDIEQLMKDDGLHVGEDHPDDDYDDLWLQINDHGNMTLFKADGEGNNTEIWSIV